MSSHRNFPYIFPYFPIFSGKIWENHPPLVSIVIVDYHRRLGGSSGIAVELLYGTIDFEKNDHLVSSQQLKEKTYV
jgi:hypothetical protein